MYELPTSDDDGSVSNDQFDSDDETATRDGLSAAVVQYENRPDRQTIFPADCSNDQRLTKWISADASAFVDLDEHR